MIVGGGRSTSTNVDAMVSVLLPNGQRDYSFAPEGVKLYDLGGANDFFWGIALSPDQRMIAIVGTKSAVANGHDDAALLLRNIP